MLEQLAIKYGLKILAGLAVAGVVWWFGFYIPSKLKAVEAKLEQTEIALETAKRGLVLLDDIQKGKVKIDAQVQQQISSIRATVVKPGAVLIPGGMPKSVPAASHTAR